MKKTNLCIVALSCIFCACSADDDFTEPGDHDVDIEEENKLGENCPENIQTYYSDDEYSELKNGDNGLKQTIKETGRCNDSYPYCRITMNEEDWRNDKFYCARCAPGEIYGKGASGANGCFSCASLVESEEECSSGWCLELINRCLNELHGDVAVDNLKADKSEVTLIYDLPQTIGITYKSEQNSIKNVELEIVEGQNNNCVDFLTESLVTDRKSVV